MSQVLRVIGLNKFQEKKDPGKASSFTVWLGSGALLGGPRLLGCLMINLSSRVKHYFQYKVLISANLKLNTILSLNLDM